MSTETWQLKSLGEVATLKRGYDLPTKERIEGDVPIFAANGPIGFHCEEKVTGPGVVTGRSGTIGKVHYVDDGFWPLNTALYVQDFHGNHPKFVYYLLAAMRLEQFSSGTGVPTLNRNLVHPVNIRVPPLEEQRRIATILDKADALRRKRQESLALMDEFLRSVFLEMFGDPFAPGSKWPKAKIGSVAEDVRYGTSSKANTDGDGLPVLRMGNMTYEGRWLLDDLKWCPLNESDIDKYTVQPRDMLFNRTNSPDLVGKTAVWTLEEPFAYAGYLIRVRFDLSLMLPEFASACLNSASGKKYLFSTAKPSNNMSNFNASMLKSIELPRPPIEEQLNFLAILERLELLRNKAICSLEETENMLRSLIQKAFRGELTGEGDSIC